MGLPVLLLGGTAESRCLAGELCAWPQLRVVTSLAGRVRDPLLPAGEVRIGGFGGRSGLVDWLRTQQVRAVIDATHPFAEVITASAVAATAQLGLPLLVLRRPGWQAGPGDDWHWADSLPDAARVLPGLGRRVFLTVGRAGATAFAELDRMWFLLRVIDPAGADAGGVRFTARHAVVSGRGPFTVDGELELLRRYRIDVLVTKDSGGALTAPKLAAARRLGLPVLLVRRPPLPPVPVVQAQTTGEALRWLTATLLA
jgi:precorrin-6A/cobalt-precorrin-6A reductase